MYYYFKYLFQILTTLNKLTIMLVNTRFIAYIKTQLLADNIHNTPHPTPLSWTKNPFFPGKWTTHSIQVAARTLYQISMGYCEIIWVKSWGQAFGHSIKTTINH